MILDLPTVVALTALSAFLMGASISLASLTQSTSDPCMRSLGYGCLLQSLGWLMEGWRQYIPDTWAVFGSDLAFVASGVCFLSAVNVFLDRPGQTKKLPTPKIQKAIWVLCGIYCVALCSLTFLIPSLPARIIATSLAYGVLNLLCVIRLLGAHSIPKSRQVVGIGFGLVVALQVFRATLVLFSPSRTVEMDALMVSQTVMLIFSHITVVMLTFLFVLMVHDRTTHELSELVTHDYLTGTFNRSAFEGFARQAIEQAQRSGEELSLLLFDVDHFKSINDTLGHLTGDVALKSLSEITAQNLRSQDVLGRYGGEEFAVLLPGSDAEGALLVAERIRESVAETEFRDEATVFRLTISIGLAELPFGGQISTEKRLTSLFRAADTALYEAKRMGRNRTLVATAEGQADLSPKVPVDLNREG